MGAVKPSPERRHLFRDVGSREKIARDGAASILAEANNEVREMLEGYQGPETRDSGGAEGASREGRAWVVEAARGGEGAEEAAARESAWSTLPSSGQGAH